MIERRCELRLAQEALHATRIRGAIGSQNLQRDGAAELLVPRGVDLTHSSAAEECVDRIATDGCAGRD